MIPVLVVSVGDREADLYELFVAAVSQPGTPKLLVRAERDRLVADGQGHLWAQVERQPLAGRQALRVPRRPGQPARVAELEVRFAALTLRPPKRKPKLGHRARVGSAGARDRSAGRRGAHRMESTGLKILVSAVQSRPCPPSPFS